MLVIALAVGLGLPANQHAQFSIGPIPDWVEQADLGDVGSDPVREIAGGMFNLLADSQDRFVDGEVTRFFDNAWQLVDPQGVHLGSQIEIDFDPEFETLTIHTIELVRDGQAFERLAPSEVQVLQREQNLDARIYDGRKTAVIFVRDVRPGDVVRHSYTLHGSNPAYAGHYSREVHFATGQPTRYLRHRLIFPADRPLTIVAQGPGVVPEPTIVEEAGYRTYSWEARDVPNLLVANPTPTWYLPWPSLQLSTLTSWNELALLEIELLAIPDSIGSALQAEVDKLRDRADTPQELAWEAVRFVQNEVRYLGIELGVGAYEATPPDEVYERRFGDCKDKSVLLATLLRELDIESRVAIVSSWRQHTIASMAPSPVVFDHVIVRIDLDDGSYWVDPTEALVGGDLRTHMPPPFGLALVADELSVEPEPVPLSGTPPSSHVEYTIDARRTGEAAALDVNTRYVGRAADEMRSYYGWTTPSQFSQNCHDYYKSIYTSVELNAQVDFADDLAANVVITKESYSVPSFWEDDGDGGYWAQVYAQETASTLPIVSSGGEHPVGVAHPIRSTQSIEVRLDEGSFDTEQETIENPAFTLTYTAKCTEHPQGGVVLRLDYSYASKADHVPVDAIEQVARDVARAEKLLQYSIAWEEGVNWLEALAFGFMDTSTPSDASTQSDTAPLSNASTPSDARKTNRSAILLRPKAPWLKWTRSNDPTATADETFMRMQDQPTVCLLPERPGGQDQQALLRSYWPPLFEEALLGWKADSDLWPKDRTYEMFLEWFDVQWMPTVVVLDLEESLGHQK